MDEVERAAAALNAALAIQQQRITANPRERVEPPKPGIYAGVPMSTYLAWDALSASLLEPLVTYSAEAAKWVLDYGIRMTEAMRQGTAIHCATLEAERFEAEYRTVAKPWNENPNKEERDKLLGQGFQVLGPMEYAACLKARRNVYGHPDLEPLFAGDWKAEFCIVWEQPTSSGVIRCKARPDFWDPRTTVMLDLKSTNDVRRRAFLGIIRRFGYHRKVMFYAMGAKAVGLPCASIILAAVKASDTCDVKPYWFHQRALDRAYSEILEASEVYGHARATGKWAPMLPDGFEVSEEDIYGRSVPRTDEVLE